MRVGSYDLDFSWVGPVWGALIRATWLTLYLASLSTLIGTCFGVVLGPLLNTKWLGVALVGINDIIRAVPNFLWLLLVYAFPYKDVFPSLTPPNEFNCAVIGIAIPQAAFTAELYRSARRAVSPRPVAAAEALGLSPYDLWRYFILPDVTRQMIAPIWAFYISNIKLSALASIIGVHEILYVTQVATSSNMRTFEAWLVATIFYVLIILPVSGVGRLLEKSSWIKRRA